MCRHSGFPPRADPLGCLTSHIPPHQLAILEEPPAMEDRSTSVLDPPRTRTNPNGPGQEAVFLDYVKSRGAEGATDREVEIGTGLPYTGLCRLRKTLIGKGLLRQSGKRS